MRHQVSHLKETQLIVPAPFGRLRAEGRQRPDLDET